MRASGLVTTAASAAVTATAATTTAIATTATAAETTASAAISATAAEAATATAAATVATAITTTAATVAATTTAARLLRFGFVDRDLATAELRIVHRRDRRLRFVIAAHFDETETAAAAGIAITNDASRNDRAVCRKGLSQRIVIN